MGRRCADGMGTQATTVASIQIDRIAGTTALIARSVGGYVGISIQGLRACDDNVQQSNRVGAPRPLASCPAPCLSALPTFPRRAWLGPRGGILQNAGDIYARLQRWPGEHSPAKRG